MTQFLELIDDLITDIPKIWLFLAEFLERFIQTENAFVELYQTVFENLLPNKHVAGCIITILSHASDRLGKDFMKELVDTHLRSFVDLVISQEGISEQLECHKLTFLIKADESLPENKFSDSFKSELISLLPNDVEKIYGLLEARFTLAEMQTDEFVYFMACCVFSFICGNSFFLFASLLLSNPIRVG